MEHHARDDHTSGPRRKTLKFNSKGLISELSESSLTKVYQLLSPGLNMINLLIHLLNVTNGEKVLNFDLVFDPSQSVSPLC